MDPQTREQMIFEANRKSTGASYLLWFFLGFLGAHRFYLGRTKSGIAQFLLCLTIVGIIPLAFWWLIDAFLIPDIVRSENMKVIEGLDSQRFAGQGRDGISRPAEPRRSLDPRVEEIRELRRR